MQAAAKCTVLLLLLAGLLVAGTEGYPSQVALPVQQQDLTAVVNGWQENSQESQQDNSKEDSNFVPDYNYDEGDYEYSEEDQGGVG